jgi:signal transduction histidine kinase
MRSKKEDRTVKRNPETVGAGEDLGGIQEDKSKLQDLSCPSPLPFPEEACQSLFEFAPGLFLVLDTNFRIIAVSEAYLQATMKKREDILGCGIFEIFPDNPADPEATGVRNLTSSLNRVLKEKIADTMALQKYDIPSPGGDFEERYWTPINVPVFDANHEIAFIIHRVEDVTEFIHLKQKGIEQEEVTEGLRKRAMMMEAEIFNRTQEVVGVNLSLRRVVQELAITNNELNKKTAVLEAAIKELEAFAYSISHELKNPVLSIELFSKFLAKRAKDFGPEIVEALEAIRTNNHHVRQLIDDLLDLSRAGGQKIKKSSLDLAEMTTQVFEQLRRREGDRDLQLIVKELPLALADRSLIKQVLVNLLGNAIKYTGSKITGIIVVGGKAEEKKDIYFIQDNGVGFDGKYADKLFEVFQRLHSQEEFEGTGIGLAIVKRIIERHGGRVWGEGKVDKGATFYFSLPRNGGEFR